MRLFFRARPALGLPLYLLAFIALSQSPSAMAQNTGVTQITGVVVDVQRSPVADAQVRLSGAATETTSTRNDGSFTFINLPTGTFRLDIAKAGFNSAVQDDIVTGAGNTTNLTFTLQAASLTSLTEIGHVSVSSRNGANSINTTPAAIVDVPATTFTDQGQLSVNQVLNEEPGITIGLQTGQCNFDNGSSPYHSGVASIRGGLPYETESLIDGHAISLGTSGTYSPSFISPYELQNVEIVKGPGATSPSINYAINGTVNYRTLEPTSKPEQSIDVGEDQFGGNFANFRATGTLPGGRLSYAFDYVTEGTQGFNRGFTSPALFYLDEGQTYLNGQPICLYAADSYPGGPSNIQNSFYIVNSSFMCCYPLPQAFNQRNELGKIRYAFTPSTTLTLTWLGGQTNADNDTDYIPQIDFVFDPPAGYTGAYPAGGSITDTSGGLRNGWLDFENTNLFETEFHTPLGKTATLLLRQYSSSIQCFSGGPGDSGPTAAPTQSFTGAIYGGIYFGANNTTTPTIFNGQVGTISEAQYEEYRTYNDLNGYTAEIDKQAGDDLLSLSYDYEKTSTLATQDCFGDNGLIVVPGGSSQSFESVMGRAQFELGQRVNGTISDNFGSYTDIYTQNGGVSFLSSTHTYEAPRLSLTWRPNANESVRASAGTSIAPPYIALLNNNAIITASGATGAGETYSETVNSGDVAPETAIGFDLGLDTRIHSPFTVLSVDVYQTILHDQFLSTTSQQGTYTCPASCALYYRGLTGPLYVTKTGNLGHSEYEGVELSLHRTPPTGWGYRIQGSLQRAFAYDLPPGFYDTPAGPDTANLGISPNINFQSGGLGYNGMSYSRVPYSTGYGEINYRGHNGAYFLAGITYFGPNNSYNDPAFEVVTASFTQPITRRASLQLSVYNVTNTYPAFTPLCSYGAPAAGGKNPAILTPLVNGKEGYEVANTIGPSTARLTLHIDF